MENIIVKTADNDVLKELNSVKFDISYINEASKKYKGSAFKIFNLKPHEANILKQLCLSLGFDCAVSRETVMCKCEYTDALIFASDCQLNNLVAKLQNQPFRLKELSSQLEKILNLRLMPLKIRNYTFDWKRPYIMGILNVTPNSFSDGGKYYNLNNAFNYAVELINDGADIIDIGGESTKPDAEEISADEEISRILPVIELIRKNNIDIPISVDTRHYKTAKAAIEAGADIINDVSGLDYDEDLHNYVAENNIPVVIMHSDSVPAKSSDFTKSDIVEEIYFSFFNKINKLTAAGFDRKNIIIDTGFGFGKAGKSNFELLRRMNEFKSLNVPILAGISRKSFIRNAFNLSVEEADIPTALYSAMSDCVNIHRVHNVKLVKQFLKYTEKLY